jgi:hypothetical protein
LPRREKLKGLQQRADALAVEACQLDVELEEAVDLLRERYQTIHFQSLK